MLRKKQPGQIQYCVELGLQPNQTSLSQHRQLGFVAEQLANTFDRFGLAATWAVPSATSMILRNILATRGQHDFALLADHSWPAARTDSEFVTELRERLRDADDCQVRISGLVFAGQATVAQANGAIECGLNVIRTKNLADSKRSFSAATPASKQEGKLHLRTTAMFPGFGSLLGARDAAFATKQVLHRAMKRGTTEHVSIELSQLVDKPAKLMQSLTRILALSAKLQQSGRIQVQTMRSAKLRSIAPRKRDSLPARSILRPAA